ncbi:hypothetical protein [Kitasatospora griseola]|uniref:hypothetical protein n=1 Tax=Kitasatospora griseola TaxID=2064 RepID=UPI00166FD4B9|nr:hypothetical protein [Kitasatospora griseola]GGQ97155.1 hypothetical protein GCM10010195_61290 [Kitasatospora griseola]
MARRLGLASWALRRGPGRAAEGGGRAGGLGGAAGDDSTSKQRQARGLRQAAESLVFEPAIPLAAYCTLPGFGAGQWSAITLSGLAALPWLILGLLRNRRLDAMPVFALVLLLIVVGADAWIGQWDDDPTFRRHIRLLTVLWGTGFTLDALIRVAFAMTLPIGAVPRFRNSAVRWFGGFGGAAASAVGGRGRRTRCRVGIVSVAAGRIGGMIPVEDVIGRAGPDGVLPLLTLAEFFEGNTVEDSLAPNQWGYGRPPLAELAAGLARIAERPDVAWVRVQLHPETLDLSEVLAEAVAVCTSADAANCESWTAGWESSGVVTGLVDDCLDVPPVPAGMTIRSIVWD